MHRDRVAFGLIDDDALVERYRRGQRFGGAHQRLVLHEQLADALARLARALLGDEIGSNDRERDGDEADRNAQRHAGAISAGIAFVRHRLLTVCLSCLIDWSRAHSRRSRIRSGLSPTTTFSPRQCATAPRKRSVGASPECALVLGSARGRYVKSPRKACESQAAARTGARRKSGRTCSSSIGPVVHVLAVVHEHDVAGAYARRAAPRFAAQCRASPNRWRCDPTSPSARPASCASSRHARPRASVRRTIKDGAAASRIAQCLRAIAHLRARGARAHEPGMSMAERVIADRMPGGMRCAA